jgi:GT2 family glycosyltransferase
MRILVSITYWNSADIIHVSLNALLQQTLPPEEILIVDNGSTEPANQADYPGTSVVRNEVNLGTGAAVTTGFKYAIAHGYDWVWVLDDDTRPPPDTLKRLVALAHAGETSGAGKIGIVAPTHKLLNIGRAWQGNRLTPSGPRPARGREGEDHFTCDSVIWSGALVRVAAVAEVGFPRVGLRGFWDDLSIDYGDIEYAFRMRSAGFQIVVRTDSVIDHRLGNGMCCRVFGVNFYSTNHSALRRYLYFRNLVFFWLRIYPRHNWPMLLIWFAYRTIMIVTGILFLEHERGLKLKACLCGIRDGLRGRLDGNFLESR